MVAPHKVSRNGDDRFHGLAWNAFVDLCAKGKIASLCATQKPAALAFWYMSEVNNGGHFQYFVNKAGFDHREVIAALRVLGANQCAMTLESALRAMESLPFAFPQTAEQYLEVQEEAQLSEFDNAFYQGGDDEIMRCLEEYLAAHETSFVEWIA